MNRRAFTLIEFLAVIIVLAILGGVALPRFLGQGDAADEAATKGYLGGVRTAISSWQLDQAVSGSADYPNVAQLLTDVMPEDLPKNPYNDLNTVEYIASQAVALTRATDGSTGWRYHYSNGAFKEFIFWANTNTVGENDW